MLWIDRKKYKEKIIEWWSRNDKYLIINVSDSREIMDIASCFESIQQTHCSIGVAMFNSGAINKKVDLLNQLATDLGGERKFSKFYNLKKDLGKNGNAFIFNCQQVGTNLAAEESEVSHVNQHGPVTVINPPVLEAHDDDYMDMFMSDLDNFSVNDHSLFVIQFLGDGFTVLDLSLKIWFRQNFLKKILKKKNIKIVVLDRGKLDAMLQPENHINIEKMVEHHDIQEMVKLYQKVNPAVTPESVELLSNVLMDVDGKENDRGVEYTAVSRTFRTHLEPNKGHKQVCLMKQ